MRKEIVLPALIFLAGIAIFTPLHDIQPFLTQGDIGRDLYGFERTYLGGLPYQDYLWHYGPLMPYYYSFFFFVLGVNIHSVLIGKLLLVVLTGLFVYLCLSAAVKKWVAFLAAVWLWAFNPDFTYTYNHAGGVLASTVILFCIFLYVQERKEFYIRAGFIGIFLLTLIKLNIGISVLFAFTVSYFLTDSLNKELSFKILKTRLIFSLFLVLATLLIYRMLLKGLPSYYVRQCLPFLDADSPFAIPMTQALRMLWESDVSNFLSSLPNICFGAVVMLSAVQTFIIFKRRTLPLDRNRNLILMLTAVFMFILCLSHEFLSSGIYYRLYWTTPFVIMFFFIFLGLASEQFPKILKRLLTAALLLTCLLHLSGKYSIAYAFKIPFQYLDFPRGKIYVTNTPDWLITFRETVRFLKTNLKPTETFFALPYDPIYYFALDRKSPTRLLMFFENINITPDQENNIIGDLEEKGVEWVVLSNRAHSPVLGLGVFGETHCPLLAGYIAKNFSLVTTFGDWGRSPRKAWEFHAVKILKRIQL